MESKRDLIIEAASRRFEQYGYSKTTLEEVARDVGIGKATIYHYFSGKKDLLYAVIQREAAILRKNTLEAIAKVDTPPEKLKLFLQIHFNHILRSMNIRSLNRETIYRLQPIVDAAIRGFFREQVNMLRKILDEGVEKGYFKKLDTNSLAVLLLSVLRSFFTPKIILDQSISPRKLIDAFLTIVLDGLQAKEPKTA